jgi:hypothetical protein
MMDAASCSVFFPLVTRHSSLSILDSAAKFWMNLAPQFQICSISP